MSMLIALAGPSRSGKGTAASVFAEGAELRGLNVRERQLSGPGKQYVASAFRPEITEQEAIAWFDEMKAVPQDDAHGRIVVSIGADVQGPLGIFEWVDIDDSSVPLQQYLQRMLQGARDRWGDDFWLDMLLPLGLSRVRIGDFPHDHFKDRPWWHRSFTTGPLDENGLARLQTVADVCLISDLRQVNEAERVKKLGGVVIEMRRPPIEHAYVTGSDHVTEQRLPPELVDYVIEGEAEHNEETLGILRERCWACWHEVCHDWRTR